MYNIFFQQLSEKAQNIKVVDSGGHLITCSICQTCFWISDHSLAKDREGRVKITTPSNSIKIRLIAGIMAFTSAAYSAPVNTCIFYFWKKLPYK